MRAGFRNHSNLHQQEKNGRRRLGKVDTHFEVTSVAHHNTDVDCRRKNASPGKNAAHSLSAELCSYHFENKDANIPTKFK